MRKSLVSAAVLTLTAALGLVPAGSSALGASRASSVASIPLRTASATLAGVVNVSKLPRATPVRGPARVLPRLTPSGAVPAIAGGAAPAPSHPARSPDAAPTLTKGTKLTPALDSSDNPFGLTPPDMAIAAGGGKVIQMVNVVGRVWTGTTPGPVFNLSDFFGTGTDFISDPWIFYDFPSGRFFAGIFDIDLGGEAIAISKTSNPAGAYWIYQIPYPSDMVTDGGCPDQGKLGVDADTVGLSFNEFDTHGCPGTSAYLGVGIELFRKVDLMAGADTTFQYTDPLPAYFSLVPAHTMTANHTLSFASLDFGSGTKVHEVTSSGVPPTASLDILPNVTVPTYSNPPLAKQPGTTTKIDSGDDRVQHVVRRSNNLVLTAGVGCKPGGDTKNRACVRIISINTTTNALNYSVELSRKAHYYLYPAPGLNSAQQAIIGFGDSGGGTYPRLMGTAGDTAGNFAAPVKLQSGSQPNTSMRYGDYFAVAIDPASPTDGWIAGEVGGPLSGSFDWNTAVRLLRVS